MASTLLVNAFFWLAPNSTPIIVTNAPNIVVTIAVSTDVRLSYQAVNIRNAKNDMTIKHKQTPQNTVSM